MKEHRSPGNCYIRRVGKVGWGAGRGTFCSKVSQRNFGSRKTTECNSNSNGGSTPLGRGNKRRAPAPMPAHPCLRTGRHGALGVSFRNGEDVALSSHPANTVMALHQSPGQRGRQDSASPLMATLPRPGSRCRALPGTDFRWQMVALL